MDIKTMVCSVVGAIGSIIASAFGGWDEGLGFLIFAMAADYITGLIVAGIFKKSPKTDTGALESRAGWKGLCRKGMTILYVLIAQQLDILMGVDYIRNAVIIGFIANEVLSITENGGLMGVSYPEPVKKAIDILIKKNNGSDKGDG